MDTCSSDEAPDLVIVERQAERDLDSKSKQQEEDMYHGKVPITIVTGYLGSGKSTLLSHVASQKDRKIALIMNEFGDSADVERSLTVKDGDTMYEEWLELDNGCLCCSVKDSGVMAIENLMKKRGRFDYILLETTGVADPGPIVDIFWLDSALAASIYLDGVVTMMDAGSIVEQLDDVTVEDAHHGEIPHAPMSTANIQIAHADVLVLNKCDTVADPKSLEHVRARVRGINSLAKYIETSFSRLNLSEILDLRAYEGKAVDVDRMQAHSHGWHDPRIGTVVFEFPAIDSHMSVRVDEWLRHSLWDNEASGVPIEVHRTKAKVVSCSGLVSVIQGVKQTYDVIETDQREPGAHSKIVFIGKNLRKDVLVHSFCTFMGLAAR